MKILKALALIGCLLMMWGIIWGIFSKTFILGAIGGLILMVPYLIWGDVEE